MKAQITEITTEDQAFYGDKMHQILEAQQTVLDKLEKFEGIYRKQTGHEMAEHVKSRIKSRESMMEKCVRQHLEPNAETALRCMTDYIGIRVVCSFVKDVFAIVDALKADNRFEVIKDKDYITHPKPNGYRSYHFIVAVPVGTGEKMAVEIQLRTIAQDCWASLEHQLRYKRKIPHEAMLVSELKRCAEEMASTDLSMQTIRDLIEEDSE
ncbi:MAG: GTP pyrophosphokinase family protein [Eubacteriaceae bacterium]|nr:GTP pyrophosphokinase family protein [Eubacteriaceae bacterium]MDD4507925.1 GTP pyrophosphokinase family protein [Eubacteriaceae bacterium]